MPSIFLDFLFWYLGSGIGACPYCYSQQVKGNESNKGVWIPTGQQFAEQTSYFSLVWSKMYIDRKLLKNSVKGSLCFLVPK